MGEVLVSEYYDKAVEVKKKTNSVELLQLHENISEIVLTVLSVHSLTLTALESIRSETLFIIYYLPLLRFGFPKLCHLLAWKMMNGLFITAKDNHGHPMGILFQCLINSFNVFILNNLVH